MAFDSRRPDDPGAYAPGTGAAAANLPAEPLLVLTQDPQLSALAAQVMDGRHPVIPVGSELDLSGALLSHHAGVALLDTAALATPPAALAARLREQFPEVVLVVAGDARDQAALAAQITDGIVHRFLHKPVSEQRVRLFVEAGWRRRADLPSGGPPDRDAAPRREGRLPWRQGVAAAVAALAVAAGLWVMLRGHRSEPRPSPHTALPATVAPAVAHPSTPPPPPPAAAPRDELLEQLLAGAGAHLRVDHLRSAQQLADQAYQRAPGDPRTAALIAEIGARRGQVTRLLRSAAKPVRAATRAAPAAARATIPSPVSAAPQPAAEPDAAGAAPASEPGPAADAAWVPESSLKRSRFTAPRWPPGAREHGIQGWVEVQFTVGTDGAVSGAKIIQAQPPGTFEQSVLDAVPGWRYQPVTRAGRSVSQLARMRLRFELK